MGVYKGAVPYEKWAVKRVKLGRKDAIHAKCYECMGGYDNGKEGCMGKRCPLYPYMPYRRT